MNTIIYAVVFILVRIEAYSTFEEVMTCVAEHNMHYVSAFCTRARNVMSQYWTHYSDLQSVSLSVIASNAVDNMCLALIEYVKDGMTDKVYGLLLAALQILAIRQGGSTPASEILAGWLDLSVKDLANQLCVIQSQMQKHFTEIRKAADETLAALDIIG